MKNKTVTYIGLIIFLIICIYGTYKMRIETRLIKDRGKYTIGIIEKIKTGSKGIRVFIKYSYNKKEIESNYIVYYEDRNKINIGKRIFVKFIPPEYKNEYMRTNLDCLVPDSIISAPPTGWTKEWMKQHFPNCVDL